MLIVYGSLYPWHFAAVTSTRFDLAILLNPGAIGFDRFLLRDVVVNLALYMPLGVSGLLALKETRGRRAAGIWTVICGAALSLAVELAQQYEPGRNSSAIDFATNTIGTGIGVGIGLLFQSLALRTGRTVSKWRAGDPAALALLFVFAGYLTFPWFPHTGLYLPLHKLRLFLSSPVFEPLPLISFAALWYAVGMLLQAIRIPRPQMTLTALLVVFPLQLMITERQPGMSELAGAAIGLLLTLPGRHGKMAGTVSAVAFLAIVALRGTSPFHFDPAANPVNWTPFGGFLSDEWRKGLLVLLEKSSYYGISVWLWWRSGLTLRTSAMLVAAVLAGVEILQIHLPGRTVEVTDPILALLLAFGIGRIAKVNPSPETGKRSRSAE